MIIKARIRQLKINAETEYLYANYYLSDNHSVIGTDINEAIEELRRLDTAESRYALAKCYHYGYGALTQDRFEAIRLYKEAAEKGSRAAALAVALCYEYDEIGYHKTNRQIAQYYYEVAER